MIKPGFRVSKLEVCRSKAAFYLCNMDGLPRDELRQMAIRLWSYKTIVQGLAGEVNTANSASLSIVLLEPLDGHLG